MGNSFTCGLSYMINTRVLKKSSLTPYVKFLVDFADGFIGLS